MANYQVAWKASTKEATVQSLGDALPSGATNIGTFIHTHSSDGLGPDENHVFYHHVRDLLYAVGVEDMQSLTIAHDTTFIPITAFSITPPTATKAVAATQQITLAFTPVSPSNTNVTYTTSDATKATVSASGLITAVATGSATITATTEDGGFTDTVVLTIS